MDDTINIYCYVYAGGKLVQQNDGLWKYIGGRSKGIHVYKGMSYAEFTSRILEKFDISMELAKMHYILKFNPKVIQDLEDAGDLDNVISYSDNFAEVYIVESSCLEGVEENLPTTHVANRSLPLVLSSSCASNNDITCDVMLQSRGFSSRCAETDYTPLQSDRFREAILGSGHTLKNAEEFRNAIYQMSLGGRFQYKYLKNSPKHMSVKCSIDLCPWKITAHAVAGNEILRVHTFRDIHNHIAQDQCSSKLKVSSKRGAVIVGDVFRTTPDYLPRQICKDFSHDHGVGLTYNQAWHIKEKAKERIYGAPRDSYMFLPWLCHRLREINPGTLAEYTSTDGHFSQLFVAHAFSIQGFMQGCRPILAIDSCHLSGPYKGALLSAIAYDGDDGMFPLAIGVVSSENYEDWYWFLEKVKHLLDGKEVVIISDRHQGILRSVSELFGTENHAYCYRHLKENFTTCFNRQNIRGKKGKEDAWALLDGVAFARLEADYNDAFQKLVQFNEDLAKWVTENNPEHWAMSKFPKKRWDKMTTNIAESFNSWLREERHQTIYTLLLTHMDKLVGMLTNHINASKKWRSVVGPKTEEKLLANIMRSGPISVMPYIRGTFRVFTGEVYLVVDMNERSCSCMSWQMSGLPCAHACAVIRYSKQDVYDYVDTCFLLSTHNLIYSGQFQPLATHNMPKPSDDGSLQDGEGHSYPTLLPPNVKRPPGRPRQRRIESQFAHKRPIHCSRCNGVGHNRSKCNNPLP